MKRFIHIRLCTPDEFQDVVDCQKGAMEEMPQVDFYFPSTPNELRPLFENNSHVGFIIGAYDSERLIGFASVANWLGPYYGYLYASDDDCYSIEDTVVRAAYYGNSVQLKLWNYIIDLLPENVVLMCTIHPQNVISLRNAESLGFSQKMSAKLFGGFPRLVMERRNGSMIASDKKQHSNF